MLQTSTHTFIIIIFFAFSIPFFFSSHTIKSVLVKTWSRMLLESSPSMSQIQRNLAKSQPPMRYVVVFLFFLFQISSSSIRLLIQHPLMNMIVVNTRQPKRILVSPWKFPPQRQFFIPRCLRVERGCPPLLNNIWESLCGRSTHITPLKIYPTSHMIHTHIHTYIHNTCMRTFRSCSYAPHISLTHYRI
jgi:hypothetical protein